MTLDFVLEIWQIWATYKGKKKSFVWVEYIYMFRGGEGVTKIATKRGQK
jgi:hypothetical protein